MELFSISIHVSPTTGYLDLAAHEEVSVRDLRCRVLCSGPWPLRYIPCPTPTK